MRRYLFAPLLIFFVTLGLHSPTALSSTSVVCPIGAPDAILDFIGDPALEKSAKVREPAPEFRQARAEPPPRTPPRQQINPEVRTKDLTAETEQASKVAKTLRNGARAGDDTQDLETALVEMKGRAGAKEARIKGATSEIAREAEISDLRRIEREHELLLKYPEKFKQAQVEVNLLMSNHPELKALTADIQDRFSPVTISTFLQKLERQGELPELVAGLKKYSGDPEMRARLLAFVSRDQAGTKATLNQSIHWFEEALENGNFKKVINEIDGKTGALSRSISERHTDLARRLGVSRADHEQFSRAQRYLFESESYEDFTNQMRHILRNSEEPMTLKQYQDAKNLLLDLRKDAQQAAFLDAQKDILLRFKDGAEVVGVKDGNLYNHLEVAKNGTAHTVDDLNVLQLKNKKRIEICRTVPSGSAWVGSFWFICAHGDYKTAIELGEIGATPGTSPGGYIVRMLGKEDLVTTHGATGPVIKFNNMADGGGVGGFAEVIVKPWEIELSNAQQILRVPLNSTNSPAVAQVKELMRNYDAATESGLLQIKKTLESEAVSGQIAKLQSRAANNFQQKAIREGEKFATHGKSGQPDLTWDYSKMRKDRDFQDLLAASELAKERDYKLLDQARKLKEFEATKDASALAKPIGISDPGIKSTQADAVHFYKSIGPTGVPGRASADIMRAQAAKLEQQIMKFETDKALLGKVGRNEVISLRENFQRTYDVERNLSDLSGSADLVIFKAGMLKENLKNSGGKLLPSVQEALDHLIQVKERAQAILAKVK